MKKEHESYGIIDISRFSSNKSEFFGSDLTHQGGISISIRKADIDRKYHKEWFNSGAELIQIELSANQYVDAITSGMNTSGVPCTIKSFNGDRIPQINHVINKKEQFSNEMIETQMSFSNKIDNILLKLDGNIGKKKADDIKHDLNTLKSHIVSNTNFVLTSFNEAMEKTVTEAKHSISNYINHKVNSLGIEGMKKQLEISIESNK